MENIGTRDFFFKFFSACQRPRFPIAQYLWYWMINPKTSSNTSKSNYYYFSFLSLYIICFLRDAQIHKVLRNKNNFKPHVEPAERVQCTSYVTAFDRSDFGSTTAHLILEKSYRMFGRQPAMLIIYYTIIVIVIIFVLLITKLRHLGQLDYIHINTQVCTYCNYFFISGIFELDWVVQFHFS